ncbi:MAG: class I SAM-dependent methyltransferase [Acidimicrobiales bacterium]|nr:class I SAM-dependent methyltransferase [Acidimicrobiales bacterium]
MADELDPTATPGEQAGAHTSAKGTWSWRLKSAYATTARAAGKVLTKARIIPADPPPRDQRFKHWLTSLTRVHDSLAIAELDVPWWTYKAIDEVDTWLARRPHPIRVFEWGSGASTIWLAARADEITSVEHHPDFAAIIGPRLAEHLNVTFRHVPAMASTAPAIGSRKPGSEGLDFTDYVHAIDALEGAFDLIVIDGRAREACLTVAERRLAEDGLIVFDNSHRKRYREAIASSGLTERAFGGLTPTLPYPDRTSLLTHP